MMSCYYPTTIVAIDDDEDFLNTIQLYLQTSNYASYKSPNKAIHSLLKPSFNNRLYSRLLSSPIKSALEDSHSTPESYPLFVNLRKLHEEIYSGERFGDVSVMIIDYYMSEMNGVETCQMLAQHPAKKILLTGGLDKEKVAIEAFNKGIIHRFINKADPNFPTQLKQAITVLQEAYFKDQTRSIIPNLPAASAQLLNNAAYVNFTQNLKNQLNAVEYYLLDISGSILYLNKHGYPTWLNTKSDAELTDYERIIDGSDYSDSILQVIKERQKIPFFFSESDYQQSIKDWDKYLHKAFAFPGIPNQFYSLINGYVRDTLDKKRIASYVNYCAPKEKIAAAP